MEDKQKVRLAIYTVRNSLFELNMLIEAADFIASHDEECAEVEIFDVLSGIITELMLTSHEVFNIVMKDADSRRDSLVAPTIALSSLYTMAYADPF